MPDGLVDGDKITDLCALVILAKVLAKRRLYDVPLGPIDRYALARAMVQPQRTPRDYPPVDDGDHLRAAVEALREFGQRHEAPPFRAADLGSVQPMTLPVGGIFHLDYQYGATEPSPPLPSASPPTGALGWDANGSPTIETDVPSFIEVSWVSNPPDPRAWLRGQTEHVVHLDDAGFIPLDLEGEARVFQENLVAALGVPPQEPVRFDEQGHLDAVSQQAIMQAGVMASVQAPLQVAHVTPRPLLIPDEARSRALAEVQAAEDAAVFAALDAVGREGVIPMSELGRRIAEAPLRQERYFMSQADYEDILAFGRPEDQAEARVQAVRQPPPGLIELPDNPTIHPMPEGYVPAHARPYAGARRVTVPEFELVSSPSISLDELRNRRFDLTARTRPAPPPELPPEEKAIRDQLRSGLLSLLRHSPGPPTIWERLQHPFDIEHGFGPPPPSLAQQAHDDIVAQTDAEVFTKVFGPDSGTMTSWQRLDV